MSELESESLGHRITRAFESFIAGVREPLSRKTRRGLATKLALRKRDGAYVVRVDLPGVNERDIDVRVDGNVLTIRAERHEERTKHLRDTEYVERRHDAVSRSVSLPPGVDLEHVDAEFHRGILEARIPRVDVAAGRKIAISPPPPPSEGPTTTP